MQQLKQLSARRPKSPRPSKSGVAGSSPAGPTKNKGVNADAVTPPPSKNDDRATLNAGKALAAAKECLGLTPRCPFIGVEGQLEGDESQWRQANVRSFAPLAYEQLLADKEAL